MLTHGQLSAEKGCHDNLFVNFMLMKYEVYADFACRCAVGGVGWRVGIASHAVKTSKQSRDRVRRSPKWNSSGGESRNLLLMISLGRVFARKSPESTWDNLEICRLFSHNGRIRTRPNRHLLHISDLYLCWPPKRKHFWPSPNPIKGWSVQPLGFLLGFANRVENSRGKNLEFNWAKTEQRRSQNDEEIPEFLERFLKPFVLLLDLEKIRRRNIELRLSVQQVWNATKSRWLAWVEGHSRLAKMYEDLFWWFWRFLAKKRKKGKTIMKRLT